MIYFIQIGTSGPIKIGRSDNVYRRLKGLQGANPQELRLLGVIPEELELHCEFADIRMRGEWFECDDRLLQLIERYTFSEPEEGWDDLSRAVERHRQAHSDPDYIAGLNRDDE